MIILTIISVGRAAVRSDWQRLRWSGRRRWRHGRQGTFPQRPTERRGDEKTRGGSGGREEMQVEREGLHMIVLTLDSNSRLVASAHIRRLAGIARGAQQAQHPLSPLELAANGQAAVGLSHNEIYLGIQSSCRVVHFVDNTGFTTAKFYSRDLSTRSLSVCPRCAVASPGGRPAGVSQST